jgi:maleylpyruvate isomerase
MTLHGYYRSTASYRVRIVLNLKRLDYSQVSRHLRRGDQRSPDYLRLNPQGLVPTLELDDGTILTQSLAICEYIEEIRPYPALLPVDALARAHVRAFAQVIACDIHPIQNLKILKRLEEHGWQQPEIDGWATRVIEEGLDAAAALIAGRAGPYCFGSQLTLADVLLVPQLVNARRFGTDLRWPRLLEIEQACLKLKAFQRASPECQPDAE